MGDLALLSSRISYRAWNKFREYLIRTLGNTVLFSFLGVVLRTLDLAGGAFGLHFYHHCQHSEPNKLRIGKASHTLRAAVPPTVSAALLGAILRSDVCVVLGRERKLQSVLEHEWKSQSVFGCRAEVVVSEEEEGYGSVKTLREASERVSAISEVSEWMSQRSLASKDLRQQTANRSEELTRGKTRRSYTPHLTSEHLYPTQFALDVLLMWQGHE